MDDCSAHCVYALVYAFLFAVLDTCNSQVHNLQKLKHISLKAVICFCSKIKSSLSE